MRLELHHELTLAFLQAHRYSTASAQTLSQGLKQRHIEELAALLEECQSIPKLR